MKTKSENKTGRARRSARAASYTKNAKIVREVRVEGEAKPRPVFYARKDWYFDPHGRCCQTLGEHAIHHLEALSTRNVDGVLSSCWDALNFVYNGNVPRDIGKRLREAHGDPIPFLL